MKSTKTFDKFTPGELRLLQRIVLFIGQLYDQQDELKDIDIKLNILLKRERCRLPFCDHQASDCWSCHHIRKPFTIHETNQPTKGTRKPFPM